ncbi:hypothetical protein EXN66_Car013132 [Channa argus]|uniref:Uncharacterized protein n=1 Tax=Channa argus TaxID=215402 RepID=A0A6G1Q4M2_CHAAH|nr:hypothetical protein EXN66_Car013132 [Channa argus]KAK2900309.1 hypothetical protein Q8A73_013438 [Channa argus]
MAEGTQPEINEVTVTPEVYEAYLGLLQEVELHYINQCLNMQENSGETQRRLRMDDQRLKKELRTQEELTAQNNYLQKELIRLQDVTATQRKDTENLRTAVEDLTNQVNAQKARSNNEEPNWESADEQQRPECWWTWSPGGLMKFGLCVGVVTLGAVLLAKTFKFM